MAISQDKWDKAKEYFEAGLSLSEIVLRTEISKAQISKKSKAENWEKGNIKKQIISHAIEVATTKETLNETALSVHNELVDEQLRRRGLLFNGVEKAVKKMADLIDYGKIEEKINVAPGVQQFEERKLNTSDIKNALDGFDKASITLGVNERFNSKVEVNNANVQEIEEKRVTIIRRSDNLNND